MRRAVGSVVFEIVWAIEIAITIQIRMLVGWVAVVVVILAGVFYIMTTVRIGIAGVGICRRHEAERKYEKGKDAEKSRACIVFHKITYICLI